MLKVLLALGLSYPLIHVARWLVGYIIKRQESL